MTDRAILRLAETIGAALPYLLEDLTHPVKARAESPIELLLAAAFMIRLRMFTPDEYAVCDDVGVSQQYEWESYRIDIALLWRKKPIVFVECDGHEFHERTKEQAERDRSRDRAIQAAGIIAFRFTGREIWRDPFVCVDEALDAYSKFYAP